MRRWVVLFLLVSCGGSELPLPPRPDEMGGVPTRRHRARRAARVSKSPRAVPSSEQAEPAPATPARALAVSEEATAAPRCSSVPPLLANGATPPAPPHEPLGRDVPVPGDRPVYVLPGEDGDPRVIIYLPGMCGDSTAADHFREAARAHGTLIAVRGDAECPNGRFKWRDGPAKIHQRIRAAFEEVNATRGGALRLQQAVLFGYSQGAERAERLAALYPSHYPRLVLGGPPQKASAARLSRAVRVAFLGGELETTRNMRAGYDALRGAGIRARFFTLDCAYHGWFGTNAEQQLAEVLDWVSEP